MIQKEQISMVQTLGYTAKEAKNLLKSKTIEQIFQFNM